MKDLVIIGAGGHGKVVADIAYKCQRNLLGFIDDDPSLTQFIGLPVLGNTEKIPQFIGAAEFVIAIGNNQLRRQIVWQYPKAGWSTLVHPLAAVSLGAVIGKGSVIMPQAVLGSYCTIGNHCIINSNSVVEHDSVISDFVHISPGAVTGGGVYVGECSHIGLGAVVLNQLNIANDVILGANSTAIKDITEPGTYIGTPSKRLR